MVSVTPQEQEGYVYEEGEEVVVSLEGAREVRMSDGTPATGRTLPAWTIAEVVARRASADGPAYEIGFWHEDERYVCEVSESSIQGTA